MIKYNGMFQKDRLHFIQFVNDNGSAIDVQIDEVHVGRFLKQLSKLEKKVSPVEPQNDEPSE